MAAVSGRPFIADFNTQWVNARRRMMPDSMSTVPGHGLSAGDTDVSWFAGMAMQAIIARQGVPRSDAERREVALWSFRMAQAMSSTAMRLGAADVA
jgi:hypothetical protein